MKSLILGILLVGSFSIRAHAYTDCVLGYKVTSSASDGGGRLYYVFEQNPNNWVYSTTNTVAALEASLHQDKYICVQRATYQWVRDTLGNIDHLNITALQAIILN